MKSKIQKYVSQWKRQGYASDIPDECPHVLMQEQLAPSYKAIVFAILKNDHTLKTLGFTGTPTSWYNELKRIELSGNELKRSRQLRLTLVAKSHNEQP